MADLPRILWETVRNSVQVMFIIAAASVFGWLLIQQQVPTKVVEGLTALTNERWLVLLIVNVILLMLGCFMEGIAIMLLTIPVFMPLVARVGVDPVHFGVVMSLNLMIGLLTPPVGMCLYAVSSISKVPIWPLARELGPYIVALTVCLGLITYIPLDRRLDSEPGHGGVAMSHAAEASVDSGAARADRALDAGMRWMSSICLVILLAIVSLHRPRPVLPGHGPGMGGRSGGAGVCVDGLPGLGGRLAEPRAHRHRFHSPGAGGLRGRAACWRWSSVSLVLGFLGVFTWYGWLLTLQSQGNTSPMLVLPKPLWYAAVPASGVVMIGYTIARMVKALGGRRHTVET